MDTIRVGVVGVGSMGRTHVAAFTAAGAEVTCVCDPDEARREAVAREFGVSRTTGDLEELIGSDVDVVVVATPEALHLRPALAALQADKHVLIEKPLATTPAEANEIAAEARRSDRVVMPGLNLRYDPRYRMVKDWLREGGHGETVSLYVRRNRPAPLFTQYSRIHPAFETGSHDIDVVLWYTGQRVRRVSAVQRRRPGDVNPHAIWALMELDGGAVATLETVWLIPEGARLFRGDALELITERGMAHIDIADPGIVFWEEAGQTSRDPIFDPNSLNGSSLSVRSEVEEFLRCIRGEVDTPEMSLADAVHGVEVVDAMVRAAETGTIVEL